MHQAYYKKGFLKKYFQKLRLGEKNLVQILMNYFAISVNITVQYYNVA